MRDTLFKLGFVSIFIILWGNGMWLDSTDNIATGERSGMKLHIDYETGCEYVSTFLGELHPRVDREGKHICRDHN